jgi:hypothetical protein
VKWIVIATSFFQKMINNRRHKDNKKKEDFEEDIKSNCNRQTDRDNQNGNKICPLANVHSINNNRLRNA